eukprot:15437263-Alexandrium_andersonii.AAC.1
MLRVGGKTTHTHRSHETPSPEMMFLPHEEIVASIDTGDLRDVMQDAVFAAFQGVKDYLKDSD